MKIILTSVWFQIKYNKKCVILFFICISLCSTYDKYVSIGHLNYFPACRNIFNVNTSNSLEVVLLDLKWIQCNQKLRDLSLFILHLSSWAKIHAFDWYWFKKKGRHWKHKGKQNMNKNIKWLNATYLNLQPAGTVLSTVRPFPVYTTHFSWWAGEPQFKPELRKSASTESRLEEHAESKKLMELRNLVPGKSERKTRKFSNCSSNV